MTEQEITTHLKTKQDIFRNFLQTHLPQADKESQIISEAMRYSLLAPSKNTRSTVLLLSNEMFKGSEEQALHAAAAVELIHTYSLIHDDLPALDNDNMRRGQASNHAKYGDAIAILAGDACLTYAFELLSQSEIESKILIKIIKELSHAAGIQGMIGGQVADIHYSHQTQKSTQTHTSEDKEAILHYIHQNKTGSLIASSAVIGALTSHTESATALTKIREAASLMGLAFQIADDILDEEGKEQVLGKRVRKDKHKNKLTYPSLHGLQKSKRACDDLLSMSTAILHEFPGSKILAAFFKRTIHRYEQN